MSKQPQKLFLNIKSSNHFCTHHLFVWFLVQLPTITCALSASCALRTRVLGLESTDRALHLHSHFAFPQVGNCTITVGSAVALTVPLVPLLLMSSIVLTVSRPVHFAICPGTYHGRRHSAAVFPPLVLLTNSHFFDVDRFCAASAFSALLRRLPATHRSDRYTNRPSPDSLGLRGTILGHSAGEDPFCTAVVTASRCLASRARSAPRKTLFRTCPRANAAGSAARALSSAHLVEPRHAHRF